MPTVFQAHGNLNPSYSVLEQMIEPMLENGRWNRKQAVERAHDLLLGVNLLAAKHDSYPVHLSGGELQRVLIALTIANDPQVMLFDEPISGIDVQNRVEIIELLKEVLKGKTGIIVSHDLLLLRELVSRIGILYGGFLVELAPASLFFKDQRHPYSRALYNAFTSLETAREMSGIRGSKGIGPAVGGKNSIFVDRCNQAIKKCYQDIPQLKLLDSRWIACHRKGVVNLIEVNKVNKTYNLQGSIWGRSKVEVLKKVSINIEAGEVVALVGESGAGKTTLGQIICNLIRWDGGEIYFDKTVCNDDVQYIFQDPEESVSPRYTILEAIREPLDIRGGPDLHARNEMARGMLGRVGLTDNNLCSRFCHQLSSGEMQRLSIGRALLASPRVLVADEPVSRLDPSEQIRVLKLLLELQTYYGVGMLFITHNLYLARKISRRIYVMRQGEMIEEGFTETVLTAPRHSYTSSLVKMTFQQQ